jgi:hypothetical protein
VRLRTWRLCVLIPPANPAHTTPIPKLFILWFGICLYRILEVIRDRPISFEVVADDFEEMNRRARKIGAWGENVCVKIPVTKYEGRACLDFDR